MLNKTMFGPFASFFKRLFPKMEFMENFVGAEAEEINHIFKQLRLPVPKEGFMSGTEGGLIFHTDAGIVIRAERKHSFKTMVYEFVAEHFGLDFKIIKPHLTAMSAERVNHEHILQPIASFETKHHIVEIVPGRKLGVTNEDVDKMSRQLEKSGISFWDGKRSDNNWFLKAMERMMKHISTDSMTINQGAANAAYLPITTPEFPRGIPVVADRMAVGWKPLFHDPKSIVTRLFGRLMPQPAKEGATIQKELYAPLREAMAEAWPDQAQAADPEKMGKFWQRCHEFTKREVSPGKPALVAGWVEKVGAEGKNGLAANAAEKYKAELKGNLHL